MLVKSINGNDGWLVSESEELVIVLLLSLLPTDCSTAKLIIKLQY